MLQPHYATCCSSPLQTAAQLERGASPNYSAQPWWEKQSEDERKLDKQGKLEGGRRSSSLIFSSCPVELRGTGVLFLFVDCGALPRQQLLLLYPLLWSNPSLSCTVCLWDRYHSHSGDEAAGCGGSATSSVMDLFSTKGCSRFYLLPKKVAGVHLPCPSS